MRAFRLRELAVLAVLVFAAPAAAQDDGVFIDPDSPSAKEYGIPLERERRQADPGGGPSGEIVQGERSSPIFGVGIVIARRADGAGSSPRADTAESRQGEDRGSGTSTSKPEARERDADASVLQAATSNPGPPAGGIRVPLTIGGVAIGVLLLGGLAGLLLRRRA